MVTGDDDYIIVTADGDYIIVVTIMKTDLPAVWQKYFSVVVSVPVGSVGVSLVVMSVTEIKESFKLYQNRCGLKRALYKPSEWMNGSDFHVS